MWESISLAFILESDKFLNTMNIFLTKSEVADYFIILTNKDFDWKIYSQQHNPK